MNQSGGWPRPETGRPLGVSFEYSVLCHLRPVHTGPESRHGERTRQGRGRRPESGWAFRRCGSGPPLSSMEGAPPARHRALKARAGDARKIDTSAFRLMAAAQPVDGAALIRRYRSVQLRGGQLGSIPSAL
jgi:hypothetical protein